MRGRRGYSTCMHETQTLPPQHQDHQPGRQRELTPQPQTESATRGSDRLKDRVVLVTGGDSGIGRAVAALAAKEGADVAIAYLEENDDAEETRRLVEGKGRRCELLAGDLGQERVAKGVVERTVGRFGRLDVLVNGAGEQHPAPRPEDIRRSKSRRHFGPTFSRSFSRCSRR